jgi:hypothetical protein
MSLEFGPPKMVVEQSITVNPSRFCSFCGAQSMSNTSPIIHTQKCRYFNANVDWPMDPTFDHEIYRAPPHKAEVEEVDFWRFPPDEHAPDEADDADL